MIDFFDYSFFLYDLDTNSEFLGIARTPIFPINSESYLEVEIEYENVYRPDKLAYTFYGNSELSWVIDEVNNFFSISEYYIGRKIKILKPELLENLGIFK